MDSELLDEFVKIYSGSFEQKLKLMVESSNEMLESYNELNKAKTQEVGWKNRELLNRYTNHNSKLLELYEMSESLVKMLEQLDNEQTNGE